MKIGIDPKVEGGGGRKDDTKCNDLELSMQTPSHVPKPSSDKNWLKLHPTLPPSSREEELTRQISNPHHRQNSQSRQNSKRINIEDNEQKLIYLASIAGIDNVEELSEISEEEVEMFRIESQIIQKSHVQQQMSLVQLSSINQDGRKEWKHPEVIEEIRKQASPLMELPPLQKGDRLLIGDKNLIGNQSDERSSDHYLESLNSIESLGDLEDLEQPPQEMKTIDPYESQVAGHQSYVDMQLGKIREQQEMKDLPGVARLAEQVKMMQEEDHTSSTHTLKTAHHDQPQDIFKLESDKHLKVPPLQLPKNESNVLDNKKVTISTIVMNNPIIIMNQAGVTNSEAFAGDIRRQRLNLFQEFKCVSVILWILLLLILLVQGTDLILKSQVTYILLGREESRNFAAAIEKLLKDGATTEIAFVAIYLLRPTLIILFAIIQCFSRNWRRPQIIRTVSKIIVSVFLAFNIDGAINEEGGFANAMFGFSSYLLLVSLPLQILIGHWDNSGDVPLALEEMKAGKDPDLDLSLKQTVTLTLLSLISMVVLVVLYAGVQFKFLLQPLYNEEMEKHKLRRKEFKIICERLKRNIKKLKLKQQQLQQNMEMQIDILQDRILTLAGKKEESHLESDVANLIGYQPGGAQSSSRGGNPKQELRRQVKILMKLQQHAQEESLTLESEIENQTLYYSEYRHQASKSPRKGKHIDASDLPQLQMITLTYQPMRFFTEYIPRTGHGLSWIGHFILYLLGCGVFALIIFIGPGLL